MLDTDKNISFFTDTDVISFDTDVISLPKFFIQVSVKSISQLPNSFKTH